MFNEGDVVVYRRHVCTVAGVREKYYKDKDYFELHAVFERALKLYVAIDEAKPPLVRFPMEEAQAKAFLERFPFLDPIDEEALKAQASTATLIERRIKEEFERLLKTLDPDDLIPIIRTTNARTKRREAAGRPIAAVDKKYMDMAKQFLCDELAVSLSMDRDAVEALAMEKLAL